MLHTNVCHELRPGDYRTTVRSQHLAKDVSAATNNRNKSSPRRVFGGPYGAKLSPRVVAISVFLYSILLIDHAQLSRIARVPHVHLGMAFMAKPGRNVN